MNLVNEIESNTRKSIWSIYCVVGLMLAIYLSVVDASRDEAFFIFSSFGFLIISGAATGLNLLISFCRKKWIYAIITLVWIVYFTINTNQLYYRANRFPLAVFMLVFMGWALTNIGDNVFQSAINNLLYLILFLEVCGIINYFISPRVDARMVFTFVNSILEGDAIIYMLLIAILFASDIYIKLAVIIISFMATVLTLNRMTLLEWVFIMLVYSIVKREEIKSFINKDRKKARIIGVIVLLVSIVLCIALRNQIIGFLYSVVYRMLITFSSDSSKDASKAYRLFALKNTLKMYPDGPLIEILLGRGCMQAYYNLIEYAKPFFDIPASLGPIENTFVSVLYDYGLIGFGLYFGTFVVAIYKAVVDKEIIVRKISILVVGIMTTSALVDMQYWNNMCFILFTTIGLWMGICDKKHE